MAELNNTIVRGKLRVTSEAEAQTIYENGTSLASKYLQLSGGTLGSGGTGSGDSSTNAILEVDGGIIKIKNYGNTFSIGQRNASFVHLENTNGATFYFGNHITVAGMVYPYADKTHYLGGADNQWARIYGETIYENGTSLANKYYLASNPNGYTSNTGTVTSVAVKMNGSTVGTVTTSGTIDLGTVLTSKPSYTFAGTAVTSGGNSGTAVAAVTGYGSFSGGSGSLTGNTTASGGIPYVEASLSGTELTLTVKYLHHGHTAASLGSPSTSNCAPSGHTHSVTAAGNVS